MNAEDISTRDLLECAVAAAVSAPFNVPNAGTLFALKVYFKAFCNTGFCT